VPTLRNVHESKVSRDLWGWVINILLLLFCGAMMYAALQGRVFASLFFAAEHHRYFHLVEKPSLLLGLMGALMVCFRTFVWLRYRAFPAVEWSEAPRLTVIIPAYNEGPMVAKSVDSVAAARYPAGRLQIVAVDDGSRDDTWQHIQEAAKRHPGLVEPIHFEKNQGKRAALEAGFRRASGDVVVTIDSDSVIEESSLLAMAGPFRDPKVGAVAGRVAVYNRSRSFIARMLHVRFVLSFDFLRATQSAYGIVFCCPGALAGYRMSVVREVLDDWVGQRFLGVKCTYGEDRAMTNFILAKGYRTVYQRSAAVHTLVPETYTRLCKMYLRWDRSAIREDIRLLWVLRRQPWFSKLIAVIEAFLRNVRQPVAWISLLFLATMTVHDPSTLLRVILAVGIVSTVNMLYYMRSERSWQFVFGVMYAYFSMFALFWIFPYALVTLRSRSWMTR
jgi:hyaluronan synthase